MDPCYLDSGSRQRESEGTREQEKYVFFLLDNMTISDVLSVRQCVGLRERERAEEREPRF